MTTNTNREPIYFGSCGAFLLVWRVSQTGTQWHAEQRRQHGTPVLARRAMS